MQHYTATGRLTRDPEVRSYQKSTGEQDITVRFRLAIQRPVKDQDGNRKADFIPCVAFGKVAEVIEKYIHKGDRVLVEGVFNSGQYESDKGETVYTLEAIVRKVEFLELRQDSYDTHRVSGKGAGTADRTKDQVIYDWMEADEYATEVNAKLPWD